jgi:diguanylate cyclase (GGDEF)-like protein
MLSFRNRLLILLLGLVVGAQVVTLFTALARTAATERQRADAQLVAGAHIAQRLLEYRERQLANTVAVLTADFGLREAVATGDRPTVASALANHAARIGATLTLALDLDGNVIARGEGSAPVDPALVAAVDAAADGAAQFVTTASGVHQIFTSPVLAPDEIGRIAVGFTINERLAGELRDLVGVEVAFLAGGAEGRPVAAGTMAGLRDAPFLVPAKLRDAPSVVSIGGEDYLATVTHLGSSGPALDLALFKPMREVMAPFRQLALNLGLIIGVTLAAAVLAGIYLGRSAARPVLQLAAGAARVAAGNYSERVEGAGGRELANLAEAFNSMQRGIADREARLLHLAGHDGATGLPNRVFAEDWIGAQLRALPDGANLGIVVLAITNLREISASLGFEIAEQLVRHVARRIEPGHGAHGLVARTDAAYFAVVTRFATDGELMALLADLRARSEAPLATAGITLQAAAVLGAAVAPRDGSHATELLRCAEAALETAIRDRQPHALFAHANDAAQRRRLKLGADLPQALESGQLYLQYQPKFRMADRGVAGVEALVRWQHPVFGTVSPAEFIPIAERTGASGLLTRWVLRQAMQQLALWQAGGIRLHMAVNFSAADILDPGLLQFVLGTLRDARLAAGSLAIEITESLLLHEPEAARRNMELLRVAGVRFSIDDFGTGYSSLSQLRSLPADELKIDQSFVRSMLHGEEHQALIRAIVELAHGLGMRTVAEGVEEEAQWRMLALLGCDYAQGYLTGRPQGAEQLTQLLQASAAADAEADSGARTSSLRVLELRRRD